MSPENAMQDRLDAFDAAAAAAPLEYFPFSDRPAHKGYPGEVLTAAMLVERHRRNIRDWDMYLEEISGRSTQFHGGCC